MQEKFRPAKYFSIDRVFRNEALDATHLAEFHQIEGLVADYGLTLGNMMGIIEQFFSKCGTHTLVDLVILLNIEMFLLHLDLTNLVWVVLWCISLCIF